MKKYLILVVSWLLLGSGQLVKEASDNVWVLPCTELLENYQDFPAKEWNEVVLEYNT